MCYFPLNILRAWKEKFEQAEKRKLEDIKELQVRFISPLHFPIGDSTENITSASLAAELVVVRFGFLNAILLTDHCDDLEKFNTDT